MTSNLNKSITVCLLSFLTLFILAPQAGAELSSREIKAYQKFFQVSGAKTQYKQMLGMFLGQFQKGIGAGMRNALKNTGDLTSEKKDQIIRMTDQSMGRLLETLRREIMVVMPFDDLVEKVYIPAYSKHFQVEEIEEVTAFFETPVGHKFISATPLLMKESMALINQQYSNQLREVGSRVAKEELARLKTEIEKIRKQ